MTLDEHIRRALDRPHVARARALAHDPVAYQYMTADILRWAELPESMRRWEQARLALKLARQLAAAGADRGGAG